MHPVAERFKRMRARLGITQAELASGIEVTKQAVSAYETGKAKPGSEVVNRLLTDYHVNPSWLLHGQGETFVGDGAPPQSDDKSAEHVLTHMQRNAVTADPLPAEVISRAVLIRRITPQGEPTGDGVVADREEVELRARTEASSVRRFTMPTDAMQGVIEAGTPLDVTEGEAYDGPGIYMLLVDGYPDVAYLQHRPGGGWRIAYANPAYQESQLVPTSEGGELVAAESGFAVTLRIVGRVRGSYKMH